METKPTYHYDQHGHMLHDQDTVFVNGKKGIIYWEPTYNQWAIAFGFGKFAALNLYHAKDLSFGGHKA